MSSYLNCSGLSRQSLPGIVLRGVLRLIPRGMVVPIMQGTLRGKRWVVGSGVHGYWLGSYEWEKRQLFEHLMRPGGVVFDVGANVGFYTLLAAGLVGPSGKVVAFEPLPTNLAYLRRHLQLNSVQNVRVFAAAVWDECGVVRFQPGPSAAQGYAGSSGNLEVRAVTLDQLVSRGDVPTPDLIKMDIEGGELRALTGARTLLAESGPVIMLATHGAGIHRACCDLLKDVGYRVEPLLPGLDLEEADEVLARKA